MGKNINRMLVAPEQSHTTEERLIEDKIAYGIKTLKRLTSELDDKLFGTEWDEAGIKAREIAAVTDYIEKLEYRLVDVRDINAQFARIQAHIDRLESQNKEK